MKCEWIKMINGGNYAVLPFLRSTLFLTSFARHTAIGSKRTRRTPNCRWICHVLPRIDKKQHNQILMNLFSSQNGAHFELHGRVCFMLFRAICAVTFYCRCCKALSYFFTINNKNVSECRQEKGEIKILFLLSFDVLLPFNILHRSSAMWCGNICSNSFVTLVVWRTSFTILLINMHARDEIALCHKNISFSINAVQISAPNSCRRFASKVWH